MLSRNEMLTQTFKQLSHIFAEQNHINHADNRIDPETKTLVICGRPVFSSINKIEGNVHILNIAKGLITIQQDNTLNIEENRLWEVFLDRKYVNCEAIDRAVLALDQIYLDVLKADYGSNWESVFGKKNIESMFYQHVLRQINNAYFCEFKETEFFATLDQNLHLLFDFDLLNQIKPFASYNLFHSYINALSIRESINYFTQNNPVALNSLYYFFNAFSYNFDHLNQITSHEDFVRGDFMVLKAEYNERLGHKVIEYSYKHTKLADHESWQWLLFKATQKNYDQLKKVYLKNSSPTRKDKYAYEYFSLCREMISALAKTKLKLDEKTQNMLLKQCVHDGISFDRTGIAFNWDEKYFDCALIQDGSVFRKGLESVFKAASKHKLTEVQISTLFSQKGLITNITPLLYRVFKDQAINIKEDYLENLIETLFPEIFALKFLPETHAV